MFTVAPSFDEGTAPCLSLALPSGEDRVEEGSVVLAWAQGGPFQNQVSCACHAATGSRHGWRESAGAGQQDGLLKVFRREREKRLGSEVDGFF